MARRQVVLFVRSESSERVTAQNCYQREQKDSNSLDADWCCLIYHILPEAGKE